jgi:transcriptional regulator with GAF, ATPase, and Fis domain
MMNESINFSEAVPTKEKSKVYLFLKFIFQLSHADHMIFSSASIATDGLRYTFGELENFTSFYDEMLMLCLPKIENFTQPKLLHNSEWNYCDLNSFESSLSVEHVLYVPVLENQVLIGSLLFSYLKDNLPEGGFAENEAIDLASSLSYLLEENRVTRQLGDNIEIELGQKLAAIYNRNSLEDLLKNVLKNNLNYLSSTIFICRPEENMVENFFKCNDLIPGPLVFKNQINFGECSSDDAFLRKTFYHNSPLLLDFEGKTPPRELSVFTQDAFAFNGSCHAGVLVNLFRGSAVVGNWIMLFENRKSVSDRTIRLIENIADRMTMAVSNIISEEAIIAARFENDIFQAINLEISQTMDENLLTNLNPLLQKLFNFTHSFVSLIDDEQATATLCLKDANSTIRNNPRYHEIITTGYPLADGVLNKAFLSNAPIVFDLKDENLITYMPRYMWFLSENGTKKVVTSPLQVRSKTIGIWFICQSSDLGFSTHQLQMIKRISSPMSIVVDNKRSIGAIMAGEVQNGRLLRLNFDQTKITTRADLQDIYQRHLNGLIDFVETQILLMNSDKSFYDFLTFGPNSHLEADADILYPKNFRLDEEYFNRIMRTDEVVSFDLAAEVLKPDVSRYLLQDYNNGILEKLCIKIRSEGNTIGILTINLTAKKNYQKSTLQLIKAISYQLANAINSLFSNEVLRQREYERDLLLSLSTQIAGVSSMYDLLCVIKQQLSVLPGFRYTFLTTLNADGETVRPFIFDSESMICLKAADRHCLTKSWPIADGCMSRAIQSTEPVTIALLQQVGQQNLPDYLQMNDKCGITHCSIIPLLTGHKVYGFWLLMFDHADSISIVNPNLLRGLANQISVAFLNIIANDDMIIREQEKTKLEAFSNSIVSVNDKDVLANVLKKQLVEIFGVSAFVFFLINKGRTLFRPFIYDGQTELLKLPQFATMVTQDNEISNLFFDLSLNEVQFSKEERCSIYQDTIRYKISLKVNMGEELIGVMTVWHKDKYALSSQLKLWKAICPQLAIAIANIINNEKLRTQFEELNNYQSRLAEEKMYLEEETGTTPSYAEIIGQSIEMEKVYKLVSKVASSDSTVLILGETGTGKELIARAIHNDSPRKNRLMVKVNCAALPATLIESELFGHERGSFTGATERRLGKFELANHGTLFLDEVGEMPLDLQVKLLRALQEKEIERIGGKGAIKVDVRIIAATNRDLEREMNEGRFRSDLFYRLNIFPILLPPLRSRREDIPMLATYFISKFANKAGKKINSLSIRAMQQLKLYHWPGNVRELEHLIERSILLTTGDYLKEFEFPTAKSVSAGDCYGSDEHSPKTIDDNEREHILRTLKLCNGKINGKSGAASVLGVPPSTLQSKIKRLGIKKEHILRD